MKRFAGIGLLAVSLAASIQGLSADTSVTAAEAAAQSWLGLVDAGNYSQSWSTAASHLRDSIPESQWVSRMTEIRTHLGPVKSRSLKSAEFANAHPGAPDGEHVVIRYTTSFEHKADAIETVTPMKDPDGQWRVNAYSIK
jgi:hypothetical protein